MQALKKELQLLVPSLQTFLDVENLKSIASLEDLITRSETVVVFLSTGYFARYYTTTYIVLFVPSSI